MHLSDRDIRLLQSADRRLEQLFQVVAAMSPIDFMILETTRSRAAQQRAYDTGHSHALPGQSAHDFLPSLAVDVAPLPINWNNLDAFRQLSVRVLQCASTLNIPITWGGTWHMRDMPHYEISSWKETVAANYNPDGSHK